MASERIMIVDDNKAFAEELRELLYLCGYDVKVVINSLDVFKSVRKLKPNLILLDLKMKEMNGFEVADKLKHSKETFNIPIIAMSGYFPIEKESIFLDMANMDSRIRKPFAVLDLIDRIEWILNKINTDMGTAVMYGEYAQG